MHHYNKNINLRYVVLFAFERLLANGLSTILDITIEKKHNRWALFIVTVFAFLFHSVSLFTVKLNETNLSLKQGGENSSYLCVTLDNWLNVAYHISFLDTFLTFLIPFFLIVAINSIISNDLLISHLENEPDQSSSTISSASGVELSNIRNDSLEREQHDRDAELLENNGSASTVNTRRNNLPIELWLNTSTKTSKIFNALSIAYIFIYMLISIYRLSYILIDDKNDIQYYLNHTQLLPLVFTDNSKEEIGKKIFYYPYYVTFSLKFFLNVYNLPKIRDILMDR